MRECAKVGGPSGGGVGTIPAGRARQGLSPRQDQQALDKVMRPPGLVSLPVLLVSLRPSYVQDKRCSSSR